MALDSPIIIATAADENYAVGMTVAMCSVANHVPRHRALEIHILDGGVSRASWAKLSRRLGALKSNLKLIRHPLEQQRLHAFADYGGLGRLCYARLLLAELVNAERVLYLDADTLCLDDPSPLFDFELNDKVLGAVQDELLKTLSEDLVVLDLPEQEAGERYFNSGVLLINLNAWRSRQIGNSCFELLQTKGTKCKHHDQTALNWTLRGQWVALPKDWNICAEVFLPDQPVKILHFYGCVKPWADAQIGRWTHEQWHRAALREAHLLPFVHMNRMVSKQLLRQWYKRFTGRLPARN